MEWSMVARIEVGGSIPVPNVQHLASMNLTAIPDRYLRPELEADDIFPDNESPQIPVIDMCKLEADHDDELAKLDYACKEWGFFQLIGHGASAEVIEKMKSDVIEFFSLALEEKQVYAQGPKSIQGYGQALVVSDEQKLDWSDMLFLHVQPSPVRNMRFWPTCPASFRETLEKYSSELQRVSSGLLRGMAKNLGIEPQKLLSTFEDGRQGIRMNYYPPCAQAEKAMGLTPHSDAVGLTLLLQVNDVEGLQIRRNGKWLAVKPIAGAFIVNIGDIIEIMSNGVYKSIEHRAVVNEEKERMSIAAFHGPNMETNIGPIPDLVKDENPIYKTITLDEYFKLVVTNKLDGKSLLGRMKFQF
ncbi:Isopenicillin N synthase-like, Fe(2+) 2OG dioxygenase domain [Dillenia turbinata]|uniref:Isopenicillin N synthase-like, Fe(2+) 2OG dioxygenase domain n=1 Tax=Dillenia turbinata TaxID=194707 RepID=A0AAN8VH76_9MAGN